MDGQHLTKENLRTYLRYEFDQGRSAAQAWVNINKTYGDATISKQTAYNWYEKFNNGEPSVKDAPRSGRPVTFDEGQQR